MNIAHWCYISPRGGAISLPIAMKCGVLIDLAYFIGYGFRAGEQLKFRGLPSLVKSSYSLPLYCAMLCWDIIMTNSL